MNYIKDPKFKSHILLATYIILLTFIFINIEFIGGFLLRLLGVLTPFLIAAGVAFVLNIPMRALEEKVLQKLIKKERFKGLIRPISLITTIVVVFGVIISIIVYIVPQLVESSSTLVKNADAYARSLEELMNNYFNSTELLNYIGQKVLDAGEDLVKLVGTVTGNALTSILDITVSLTSVVFNIVMGLIIAVYILLSKEKLSLQSKKALYAYVNKEKADNFMDIARLSQLKFSKFVSGQVIEAVILGFLCFLGMAILKMPYMLLISTLIAVTALIPVFGAFIGTIPGVFIILMLDPTKALWFIVMIVVIQQIEGNLIYPLVVGNSIGLSAIWVLFAITLGAGYFGVLGMLIGVPLCGVIYSLISSSINKRLKEKNINSEDLQ